MGAHLTLTSSNYEKEYYFDSYPVLFKQGEKNRGVVTMISLKNHRKPILSHPPNLSHEYRFIVWICHCAQHNQDSYLQISRKIQSFKRNFWLQSITATDRGLLLLLTP